MDTLLRLDNPTAQGNGTSTVIVPTNLGVKDLILKKESGTLTAGMFDQLQVQINGKPTLDLDGALLDQMNQLDGLEAYSVQSQLRINMGLIGMLDPRMRDLTNIVTGVENKITKKMARTMQLRYKLAGATNPVLSAHAAVFESDSAKGPGMVKYTTQHQFACADGQVSFSLPNQYGDDQYAMLRRIYFNVGAGANLLTARLKVGKETIFDEDFSIQNQILSDAGFDLVSAAFAGVLQWPSDGQSGSIKDNGVADDFPFLNLRKYKRNAADNTPMTLFLEADAADTVTMTMELLGVIPD